MESLLLLVELGLAMTRAGGHGRIGSLEVGYLAGCPEGYPEEGCLVEDYREDCPPPGYPPPGCLGGSHRSSSKVEENRLRHWTWRHKSIRSCT